MASALRDLCLRLDEADVTFFRQKFGEVCFRDGVPLNPQTQELVFAGHIGEMIEWLTACVEHNYADFFEYVRSAIGSAHGTPATSTVPSPADPA